MKKIWSFCLWSAFIGLTQATASASLVSLQVPGVNLSVGEPIKAIIVTPDGNTVEQTVPYNPTLGGVDINAGLVGANASIYFPSLNAGYVWYDGHWVDNEGYYWNNGARVYVNHPHWHEYWGGYWGRYHHWDGGWHRDHPDMHIHETINVHEDHHHHYR